MNCPPKPSNEVARLAALRALDILDTPAEEQFDRFTRLARRSFGVPVALISLVDADRQWFKSNAGLDATETPREISFCGHAILDDEILVIPNALDDERFADNPLVVGAPEIRFYAGCPISSPDGHHIGTLCVIDFEPREYPDKHDLDLLRDLTAMIEDDLKHRLLATVDPLTGISNRRGFQVLGEKALGLCRRLHRPATLLYLDLDRFKDINDRLGHDHGDAVLCATANSLVSSFRDSDVIGRVGGDEFCVLLTGTADVEVPIERLRQVLAEGIPGDAQGEGIACSIGLADYDPERHASLDELASEADQRMYAEKRARRKED